MKRKEQEGMARKKVEMVSSSRIKNTPSPMKNPVHLKSSTGGEEGTEDAKVVIRHSELVEFTKRFAEEKADYEDNISSLQAEILDLKQQATERQSHKSIDSSRFRESSSKTHQQPSLRSREQETLVSPVQHQCVVKSLNEKIYECLEQQKQIFNLKSQVSKISNLYMELKSEVIELRSTEVERPKQSFSERSVGSQDQKERERVRVLEADIARLRNLNELFRTQLKNEDTELRQKNNLIQEMQNQIISLEVEMGKQCPEDLTRRVDSLEHEREHLQNQLFLQKANNRNKIDLEKTNQRLREELGSRNNETAELTARLDSLSNNNYLILVSKCCELESQIERLNKFIIQLKSEQSRNSESTHSLDQYKHKYNEMLESMRSLKEETQSQQQQPSLKLPPIEELINQLEQNPSKLKIMENIITSLKAENNQLKHVLENESTIYDNNTSHQLKEMVFRMSRTKMESEEENQTLRFKVEELEYEINRLRSRLLNNTNLSHLNESGNRTFNKSLSGSKRERLNGVLRKMAEYSKEIILPNEENSFEGEIYETVVGKLLEHIQNLEEGHDDACRLEG